jgi:glycosyltransferase involved in cell wall biosynthesis
MGLPVIATQVVGNVDAVLEGVTGRLIPPQDSETLAAAIRAYLRNEPQRVAHGRAGQMRARAEFAPRTIWLGYYRHYQALLQRAGRGLSGQSDLNHLPSAEVPPGRAA